MSVSQVKKRFSEMESYLGRDKEGLRKLKLLKDDVNVLRTSLAAAEEKAELAEVVKNAARDRADKAEAEAEELRMENQRLLGQAAAVSSRIALITANQRETDHDEKEATDIESQVKTTMKALRKHLPNCPVMLGTTGRKMPQMEMFEREAFAEGWSKRSLWILGASVAALTAMSGHVVIFTEQRLKDIERKERRRPSWASHIIDWFESNVNKSDLRLSPMAAAERNIDPEKPYHSLGG
jgi:hypothetical protein